MLFNTGSKNTLAALVAMIGAGTRTIDIIPAPFTRTARRPINPAHLNVDRCQAFGRVLAFKMREFQKTTGRHGLTREQYEWNKAVDEKKRDRHARRINMNRVRREAAKAIRSYVSDNA